MARVVALVPDLVFGSRVVEMLERAGHRVSLVGDAEGARAAAPGADVLVVDLAADADGGIALRASLDAAPRTLGVYSHVEADVAARARAAGFDLVVPRSRMAREGAELVGGLVG